MKCAPVCIQLLPLMAHLFDWVQKRMTNHRRMCVQIYACLINTECRVYVFVRLVAEKTLKSVEIMILSKIIRYSIH